MIEIKVGRSEADPGEGVVPAEDSRNVDHLRDIADWMQSEKSFGSCSGCRGGERFPLRLQTAFQPIYDLKKGKVFAYEALVRGEHGEPAESVLSGVTEETRYAFDQKCRTTAITNAVAAGLLASDAKLSINFLPNAVYSPAACIRLTLDTADRCGLPRDRLMFEFTENQKLDVAHMQAIIAAYREFGFTTAIDDFGAGYSGLSLLADFAVDLVKLDMGLIRGIDASVPRRQIVEATLGMCREMGLQVVAEGIETERELTTLIAAGVRFVQGYLLARPALGTLPVVVWPPGVAESWTNCA